MKYIIYALDKLRENIFMLYKNTVSNFNNLFQQQILEVHRKYLIRYQ